MIILPGDDGLRFEHMTGGVRVERRLLGRTGLEVSALGFGGAPLGSEFGPIDEEEGRRAVRHALERGITYFDVAPYYGRTRAETLLGEALRGIRDRVVLATKVGRYGKSNFDFRPERVLTSLEESLVRLRTDVIDVIFVHDIEFGELGTILSETIPALERARDQGKVRAIGVSGLPLPVLRRAIEGASLDVVLSYCHYHLADTTLQGGLASRAAEHGVGVVNASPLAMGLLTPEGPPEWHPAPPALKAACRRAAEACAREGADLAALALRFAVDTTIVATTLVGMPTVAHVDRNLESIARPLDHSLLERVRAVLEPVDGTTWPSGRPENSL